MKWFTTLGLVATVVGWKIVGLEFVIGFSDSKATAQTPTLPQQQETRLLLDGGRTQEQQRRQRLRRRRRYRRNQNSPKRRRRRKGSSQTNKPNRNKKKKKKKKNKNHTKTNNNKPEACTAFEANVQKIHLEIQQLQAALQKAQNRCQKEVLESATAMWTDKQEQCPGFMGCKVKEGLL